MGRQALIAALCWVLQGTFAVNLVLNNNPSADNVKRLYRNGITQYGMYKYGPSSPYGSFTYQVPYVISPKSLPRAAMVPRAAISNSKIVQDISQIYLKDSYGNKYIPTPHATPLKPLTPQQFLQLQALPAHLIQPLSATPLNLNFKQTPATQQTVYASQYQLPQQHTTPETHYVYEQSHPGGSTQAQTSLSPPTFQTHFGSLFQYSTPQHSNKYEHSPLAYASFPELQESLSNKAVQQQSTSNDKHVYSISSTISPIQYSTSKPKYQIESEEIYNEEKKKAVRNVKSILNKNKGNVASVQTVVNGKKAIVNIETKPTLPLLDINLLEPLTFDNPITPQVQHYLPRIHDANYVKLSDLNTKNKKHQKEFVIHKSKLLRPAFGAGYGVSKTKKIEQKRKSPSVEIITYDEIAQASTARPTIVTEDAPQKKPEMSFAINPGYKETYQEKAVTYNKVTNSKPVHYSYGSHKREEPIQYTYTHSSKEPLHIKSIRYEGHGEGPKGNKPAEHKEISKLEDHSSSLESSSEEDETPHERHNQHVEDEEKIYQLKPEHVEEEYHHNSNSGPSANKQQDFSQFFSENSGFHPVGRFEEEIHVTSPDRVEKNHAQNPNLVVKQEQNIVVKKEQPQQNEQHRHQVHYQHKPLRIEIHHQSQQQPHKEFNQPQQQHKEHHYEPQLQHNEHQYEPQVHHKERNYEHQVQHKERHHDPQLQHKEHHYEHQVQHKERHHEPQLQHKEHHYEHQVQHKERHYEPQLQHKEHHYEPQVPLPQDKEHQKRHHQPLQIEQQQYHQVHVQQHQSVPPSQAPQIQSHPAHVQEKTNKNFVKQETLIENDASKENIPLDQPEHEETEQDFEKAYKDAAFGFPAYDSQPETEKDIFNPENYGVPRQSSDYKAELSPFQQYFAKGDSFPSNTRLDYLDTRDKTKDDYFLDFSINQPQFMADRYTKKVDYLKLYQKQKPENHFAIKNEGNKHAKQSEKFTAIPYDHHLAKEQKPNPAIAEFATKPVQQYDYSKFTGQKKDNLEFASVPQYSYNLNTRFVEPQFQYGFEPGALPMLLDSELAAMATNGSPQSDKTAIRKKIYKENFYIKKRSSSKASNS